MFRYALFHLVWAVLSLWVFSPFWYLVSGREELPQSYGIYLPAILVAVAVLQWAVGGRSFPLPLRAAPWTLVVLLAAVLNWPEAVWLSLLLAAVMVVAHIFGMVLCLGEVVRQPRY